MDIMDISQNQKKAVKCLLRGDLKIQATKYVYFVVNRNGEIGLKEAKQIVAEIEDAIGD